MFSEFKKMVKKIPNSPIPKQAGTWYIVGSTKALGIV